MCCDWRADLVPVGGGRGVFRAVMRTSAQSPLGALWAGLCLCARRVCLCGKVLCRSWGGLGGAAVVVVVVVVVGGFILKGESPVH